MKTITPLRKRIHQKEDEVKPRDWLNFSSAFLAVIATAILYYAGWLYTAVWFSFFGINLTQIDIAVPVILINGVPSLIAMLSLAGLAFLCWGIVRLLLDRNTASKLSLLIISVITLIAAFAVGLIILVNTIFFSVSKQLTGANHLGEILIQIFSFLVLIAILLFLWQTSEKLGDDPQKLRTILMEPMFLLSKLPQLWTTSLLLIYFMVATVVSISLGEIDAKFGRYLMGGQWHIPEVTMYSTISIKSLANHETIITQGEEFEYSSLGLLASDDNVYYLIDLKSIDYQKTKPDIYIIPRSDILTLNFILSPYIHQTPTPTPNITNTPNLIPTVTIQATP